MSTMPASHAVTRPVALPISRAMLWLIGTALVALAAAAYSIYLR